MSTSVKNDPDLKPYKPMSKSARFEADLVLKMNGYLTEKTVANLTGLSRTERYRMRVRGTFPEMKTIKGKVKGWRAKDIQDWLDSQE